MRRRLAPSPSACLQAGRWWASWRSKSESWACCVVVVFSPATCGTELTSDSLPTVIELEPLEPQPAIRASCAERCQCEAEARAPGKLGGVEVVEVHNGSAA